MQNSWYLKKDGLHHFFCKCGEYNSQEEREAEKVTELDIVEFNREEIESLDILNVYYYPDNHCTSCHNKNYLDVNALFFNDRIRYWQKINWYYTESIIDNFWSITACVKIPQINTKKDEIVFEELELSSYRVSKNGMAYYEENRGEFFKKSITIDGKYHRIDRILKEEMQKAIVDLLKRYPNNVLKWLNGRVENLEELLFFLKNPNIRFLEILKWEEIEYFLEDLNKEGSLENALALFRNHRSQKSIRKAQFSSYEEMMKRFGTYNPMVDYIFSRTISDVNHLHRALGMDIAIKKRLFNGSRIENIYYFIDFLKGFYEEKHIVYLWLTVDENDLRYALLRDTIRLFGNQELREILNNNFQKTALTIRAIHDELFRHSRRLEKIRMVDKHFTYNDFLLETEVILEEINYRLPKNNRELYEWGEALHNCLSGYANSIFEGSCTIFGLFVENKLTYAIELRNHKIVQATAIYNGTIIKSEKDKIDRWHQNIYIKNLMKIFK